MPALINDVSTDLDDPPEFPTGKPGPYPESFKSAVRKNYPDLAPLRLDRAPDDVFDHIQRLVEDQPRWTITHTDAEARVLQGVARTPLLRFRDDFVIRVRADGTGAIVDMRSRSRIGKADLGTNAKRIHAFLGTVSSSTTSVR